MKSFFIFTVLLFSVAMTSAQTKMLINKNSGGTDTIALIEIKSISFKTIPPPIDSGLVAYYPFNGNANDESGKGNNGTVVGAILTADRFANNNKAYIFDGLNDSISVANPLGLNFGTSIDFSIGVWVKFSVAQAGVRGIVTKGKNAPWAGYQLLIRDNKISMEIANGTNTVILNGTTSLNNNQWHYFTLVVSRSTNNAKLYVDGDSVANTSNAIISNSINNDAPLRIGTDRDSPFDFFNGTIDDIRIYSRMLSDIEIKSLYHLGGW